ncbi:shikimate dehydrogenase [Sinomonas sp. ASV322]|uniref:shikimate dehydrogenase n=1 Tax=Sinomonas sp. ASV322 TaxID=3041920 RepID=UPI0027DAEB44|nr:shikimate dehydrogenase [Sinomonas sp. ASV322]MDQ4501143.1 shikimate dehydrogenase [Sinomonas sp. ASV322]
MTAPRRQAAVLGHPIGHSRSPALHRAAYAALGEDIDYGSFDLVPEQLGDFISKVRDEAGWCGLSVTMPLKSALVAHVDRVVGHAASLGALNTVVFEPSPSGRPALVGHNTDVAGIVEAFRHAGVERAVRPVVVGAGNTALAAVAAIAELGATSVRFLVRNPERAGEAAGLAERLGLDAALEGFAGGAEALEEADVAVSTLPPRAADGLADELSALPRTDDGGAAPEGVAHRGVLLDVAYDPWPSKVSLAWEERGGRVLHGLEMLVYQAVEQIVLFTGRDDARTREVIDVMCDSVGLPRRTR